MLSCVNPYPPPSGWYPDPSGAPRQRYFDGKDWTEHYAPLATGAAPLVPQPTKRKVWPWVVGGVVAILLVSSAVGGHDDKKDRPTPVALSAPSAAQPHPTTLPTAPAPPKPTAAPAGSSVRDGKFEFKVINMERAKTVSDETGNPYETVTAQGEFIVVTLSIENIGNEARSFSGTNQYMVDTSGRRYDANSTAAFWMNQGTGDINPGNAIKNRVAFDVAPDTTPRELILHDSMFSGGAHLEVQVPGNAK